MPVPMGGEGAIGASARSVQIWCFNLSLGIGVAMYH